MTEEQAFQLLRWVPFSFPFSFDDEHALEGHYSKAQRTRSDVAISQWDKLHPFSTSDELAAFEELERYGVFTSKDFYSPSKAKDGHYTDKLRHFSAGNAESIANAGRTRQPSDPERAREAPSLAYAQQGRRAELRSRRQRCRSAEIS